MFENEKDYIENIKSENELLKIKLNKQYEKIIKIQCIVMSKNNEKEALKKISEIVMSE